MLAPAGYASDMDVARDCKKDRGKCVATILKLIRQLCYL